ncbi:MAG: methionyl-tRNA formyltransferase [Prevotella sp.]|jgi:methionyl-tRNA formyltransferase
MDKRDLRIIFMGTPEFAVETLKALVENEYNVVAVVTQPDKPVGRHQDHLQPSAVKVYALEHQLPVLQPVKMKDPDFLQQLKSFNADLQVVVAFRMLPEVVWAMPPMGTFNVHAALLPQYRGAAPINWAVINGEHETGVTTFFLDHDIDTGKIILQKSFAIPDTADVEYVYDGLMHLGASAAMETIDLVLRYGRDVPAVSQADVLDEMARRKGCNVDEIVLHPAPKIFKDTCAIQWNLPACKVRNFIRGLSPYPGAWTVIRVNEKESVMKIFKATLSGEPLKEGECTGDIRVSNGKLSVACADEWLFIDMLQPAGKKRMEAKVYLNGARGLEKARVTV